MSQYHEVSSVLDEIQQIMVAQKFWQSIAPSEEKLASQQPFAIDTLTFLEWLQWIYIARLRAIVDAKGQLPVGALVLPYAEEALKAEGLKISGLLDEIKKLDGLLAK